MSTPEWIGTAILLSPLALWLTVWQFKRMFRIIRRRPLVRKAAGQHSRRRVKVVYVQAPPQVPAKRGKRGWL